MLQEVKVNYTKEFDTFVALKLKLKGQITIYKINVNLIQSRLFMCKSLVQLYILIM